jgi:polysaccharide chain length determinant protein (PEP-CTERM system associated)
MINTEKVFNIENYLKIGLRRKWYIIIPFTLSVILSYGVYKYLPKEYRASTVILVRAQQVPEGYVRPTLTEPVTDRLNTISQEILSRTRLEKIIKEFNLYSDMVNKLHIEEIVDMMRKKIGVTVEEGNAFSISFEGRDPQTVMTVTNKLASMFIEENLKSRESRVEGTSQFINRELKAVESTLRKKEDMVRRFKEKNMGQLPQQLEANLRIISQLQEQLKTTSDALRAKEDRTILLQNQIEQLMNRQSESERGSSSTTLSARRSLTQGEDIHLEPGLEDPLVTQLNALKKDLANAESKYTGYHPDVADLRKKIAALSLKMKKQEEERERRLRELRQRQEEIVIERNLITEPSTLSDSANEGLIAKYQEQFSDTQSEVRRLKGEIASLKEQIVVYQKRIEDTPKKEQEMVELNRDYDLLRGQFQSLMDKKYQAQMAENLERKQQGEQFTVLDPARLPERPFKPNRNGILAMGALLGFGIGLGLTWFRESMDRSFYEVSDVETYLKLPVVATLLNLNEEEKKAA